VESGAFVITVARSLRAASVPSTSRRTSNQTFEAKEPPRVYITQHSPKWQQPPPKTHLTLPIVPSGIVLNSKYTY
jgi:hypothetical protein